VGCFDGKVFDPLYQKEGTAIDEDRNLPRFSGSLSLSLAAV
jgi:hypothetical protein